MQPIHTMSELFAQLGRSGDPADIAAFLARQTPLSGEVRLHEASFWTPSEAEFLRQAVVDDADWAEVVEQLNADLHEAH